MLHTLLIAGHSTFGVIAFIAGCVAVSRRSALPLYCAALTAMVVLVIAAVVADWSALDVQSRIVFTALTGLGCYLVWRAARACRLTAGEPAGGGLARHRERYLDDVGFTLVALFEGFAIVAVLESGGPGWLAAAVGLAGLAAGHTTINWLKRRALARP